MGVEVLKGGTVLSEDLIKMLSDATNTYGNRPVFVIVNGQRYIINDLELTANGSDYILILD